MEIWIARGSETYTLLSVLQSRSIFDGLRLRVFFHRLRLRNTVSTYCWMLTLSEIMCDKTTYFSWDTIPLNEKKQFISIFLRCICKICILELF